MSGKIYLIQDDDTLATLVETPYQNEDLLQTLLEKYPDLLAGEQIDEANPRRWLLVAREIGFPDADDGGSSMSLDHLFLDQDGIPTLVEVKRSCDTRIRREVVGQMLDYAVNAVGFWSVDFLRAQFETTITQNEQDPDEVLSQFLNLNETDENKVAAYWQQVKTNLQAQKIRLVFVADQIPPSLHRIVEFLNEQMDPAEVLAVEVRQYVGEGIKTIVPRLIGQTTEAQQKKGTGQRQIKQWNETSFFTEIGKQGEVQTRVARKIVDWAKQKATSHAWGKGLTAGSFVPSYSKQGIKIQLFALWTQGRLEFYFANIRNKPPFDRKELQQELIDKISKIDGIILPSDVMVRQPVIPLKILDIEERLDQLLAVYEWMIEVVQKE